MTHAVPTNARSATIHASYLYATTWEEVYADYVVNQLSPDPSGAYAQKKFDNAYQAAWDFVEWCETQDPGGQGHIQVVFHMTDQHQDVVL